jgi:hypothetical protein
MDRSEGWSLAGRFSSRFSQQGRKRMYHRNLAVFAVFLVLALWMSAVTLFCYPAAAQNTTQGVINGSAWQDTIPNFLIDPGEPPVVGATVQLWSTTSITGQPQQLQTTVTDALGRYQFTVNPINGPLPDFGCYEVRLILPAELGGGVIRSQEICQVAVGGQSGMDFVVRGGGTIPPPAANQGIIQGTAFRDANGNRVFDPGEVAVAGAKVELWSTTSISGQPLLLQTTQTSLLGTYQFSVAPLNGPSPDFGCYEVRLTLPADLGGGVPRSSQICQIAAGGAVQANFVLPGSVGGANRPPFALYIRVEPTGTQPGGTVRLQALGLDQDDDRLTYQWITPGGSIGSSEGSLIDWTVPNQAGNYTVGVIATDPSGASIQAQVVVPVVQGQTQFNSPPLVEGVTASTVLPQPGQIVQLMVQASDPDGDLVNNLFYFLGDVTGARVGPTTVTWQAPTRAGIYSTYAVVGDGRGGYGWAKRELSVNSDQTLNRALPYYGRAGEVLIDSNGYLLWVGINDPAVALQANILAASGAQRFVLGHIVPDPNQRHGFYLDPNTVSLAEVTAEGIQTNVEQVSRRPAFYAPGGAGGFDTWALSGRLIQFVPAR